MRDAYYYEELTGVTYDFLGNDGYPDDENVGLGQERALRPAGREMLFICKYDNEKLSMGSTYLYDCYTHFIN